MQNKLTLCGQCIILMQGAYKLKEHGRRQKITCENCKKRRYGAECDIEPKNQKHK